MVQAEAVIDIARSPREILEWILDLERYRQADRKITKVIDQPVLSADGVGTVRYRGRLRGIPTPADTNVVTLDRWRGLSFDGAPGLWTRRLVDFHGTFECTATPDGTTLRHAETFRFRPKMIDTLAERILSRWLQQEIEIEVHRLKELIEADPASDAPANTR